MPGETYGANTAVASIFRQSEAERRKREHSNNPEVYFKRGRVKQVFNTAAELSKSLINPSKFKSIAASNAPGIIEFIPETEGGTKQTTALAQPMQTGLNPVVNQNDLILYTCINGINMYMGPINTRNSPDFNPDSGLAKLLRTNTTKRAEVENPASRILDRDAFMMNATRTRVTKAGKEPKPALDDPLNLLKDTYGASRAIGIASDLTLEGKKNNSIRLGSNSEFPNIKIANGSPGTEEKLTDGSLIAMTSIASLADNFPSDTGFKLSCDSGDNEGKGPEIASGNTEGQFNYEYAKVIPGLQGQQEFNQMVMQSDRIILDSQDEDVTVSSNRHINIGAGKNMSITNKGYTVLESKNIYIGNKAKERAQPMVLGTELQKALIEIIDFIGTLAYTAPASGLGPGTPCFSGTTPLAAAINQLKQGLGLTEEFTPTGELESLEPESPKSTFLSSKHFIEPNQE